LRARFVHDSLARGTAPPDVRYFSFAATGHETVTRVNVLERNGIYPTEEMVVTRTEDAGDGTVPFWSALPRAVQKQAVVNEHSKIFHGMSFNRVFYRLLGAILASRWSPWDSRRRSKRFAFQSPPRLSTPTRV
jgi:phospholipase A1